MESKAYDVIILGGGNAGMGVTVPTRQAGLSVALIESWTLGGTCPNRGCTPKKVLVAAGHALDEIERAKAHHITVGKPSLDWPALIEREKQMIAHLPGAFAKTLETRGVDVIRGEGTFLGPNAVGVNGKRLEGKHIVIATGSKPRALPIEGAELMITSDEVLNAPDRPARVVFIGGGVIGLEFSHVFARAGSKVTILELLPRLLPNFEADAVEQIRLESQRIGIDVRTSVKVRRIERAGGALRVIFEQDGKEQSIAADRVVNGAGRVANVDGLNLDAAEVKHDRERIAVDEFMRSVSNPAVHVCGDVLTTSPQLSPIATYEGRMVGRNIVEGAKHKPDYASIPSCVFTVPALASVGLTEAAARQRGDKVTVHVNDMSDWFSARTYAETAAWAKVIVDDASDRVLGAHLVGHAGEELIHLFAFAIRFGITAGQIRDSVYGFPTYAADIKSML